MAKGGGRGKGRPRKVVTPAGNTHAEIYTPSEEIGECSTMMESNGTVTSAQPDLAEIQLTQGNGDMAKPDLEEPEIQHNNKFEERKNELPLRNKGMKLGYVAPTIKQGTPTACLDRSEIEKENLKWKKAIILYVIGESPTIAYLTTYLRKQCLIEREFDIFYHNDDYFVIRFEHLEDKDRMLFEGPYTVANRPVIVKEWEMNFCFEKEILREIPLWIQLPNLPLNCWSENSLSRIGSVVGKPICADECTSAQKRISYARMLVEVDITQPSKYAVKVEGENGVIVTQRIYYEWVPHYCQKCQKVGHICKENKDKPKVGHAPAPNQLWLRKEKEKEEGHPEPQLSIGTSKTDWVQPRKTTIATIQVGNLQVPTQNVYDVIQEVAEESNGEQGGDLIPFNQT